MERIVRQTMLYDFYGELLTEHQREAYEAVVMEDLSYAELARLEGISRQGAYDMIRRCDKQLEEYEEKLHLVERFLYMKEELKKIQEIALHIREAYRNPEDPEDPQGAGDSDQIKQINQIDQILTHAGNVLRDL